MPVETVGIQGSNKSILSYWLKSLEDILVPQVDKQWPSKRSENSSDSGDIMGICSKRFQRN